jgi:hypothetical protein
MDDLASEASETRLTYSALVAMAEASATPMPRLPAVGEYDINDGSDGVEWCEACDRYLNGPMLYYEHLIGKLHRHNVKKKKNAGCSQSILPPPLPI